MNTLHSTVCNSCIGHIISGIFYYVRSDPDPNPNPMLSGQVESESESEKKGSDPHHCLAVSMTPLSFDLAASIKPPIFTLTESRSPAHH